MPINIIGDSPPTIRLETGLHTFDRAFINKKGEIGFPLGKITEIFGETHCLDKDTFISYYVINQNGKVQNTKGGTIQRLHERFHRLDSNNLIDGRGRYERKQSIDSDFYVQSINEYNQIIRNKIIDVLYLGIDLCYKIITQSGKELTCTLDHKFYSLDNKYIPLSNLSVGDIIYIYNKTKRTGGKTKYINYSETTVKYHPNFKQKEVNGYLYYRGRICVLIYEAFKNNLSLNEYKEILNTQPPEEINKLWIVPDGYVIHHKDFNHENDSIENLELMKEDEHRKLHSNYQPPKYIVIEDKIVSIQPIGKREVYDIKCQSPYNNYIANGIVVHNCGKSTITYSIAGMIASIQKSNIALADLEGFDQEFLVDVLESSGFVDGDIYYIIEESDEDTLDKVITLMNDEKKKVNTGIVDSVGAISPMSEAEGKIGDANMGRRAFMIAQFSRKAIRVLRNNEEKSVFLINHAYPRIGGRGKVSPGGEVKNFISSIRILVKRRYYKNRYAEYPDGSYVIEGTVIKNRWGLKNKVFYLFVLAGQGIHKGLTAMYDGIMLELVDHKRVIRIGDTSFGGLKNIIQKAHDGDDKFFKPFYDVLTKEEK